MLLFLVHLPINARGSRRPHLNDSNEAWLGCTGCFSRAGATGTVGQVLTGPLFCVTWLPPVTLGLFTYTALAYYATARTYRSCDRGQTPSASATRGEESRAISYAHCKQPLFQHQNGLLSQMHICMGNLTTQILVALALV